jgi:hypothetical protein
MTAGVSTKIIVAEIDTSKLRLLKKGFEFVAAKFFPFKKFTNEDLPTFVKPTTETAIRAFSFFS